VHNCFDFIKLAPLMKKIIFLALAVLAQKLMAQHNITGAEDKGQFTGNLFLNYQKYIRDDSIGANTKVYKENSASLDAWLFLNYRIKGFEFTVRYDGFFNSPLLNPQSSYTNHGIGYWQARKKVDNLDITLGSFYDQLGSGILFRAYEQRQIGIDYAIQGARLMYDLLPNLRLKGFVGNQKGTLENRFGYSPQVVAGGNIDYMLELGDGGKAGSLNLGSSFLNRTMDRATMDVVAAEINGYDLKDRFEPTYNVYGFNGYLSYTLGNFVWNMEYNQKSAEAIRLSDGKLHLKDGKVIFTSLSYGLSGIKLGKQIASFGISVQARHIENFYLRNTPNDQLLNGMISYLPSLTRQNTYRLMARYNAPAQELGEDGIQGEMDLKPRKGTQITLNGSFVRSLKANGTNNNAIELFHEMYGEIVQSIGKKLKLKLGLQSVMYNQMRYESHPGYENVRTLTPFGEVLLKLPKSRSLRVEFQYLKTKQDQGSFANGMVEFFLKPHISFAVGDMANVQPHRYDDMGISNRVLHYPTFFAQYIAGNSVFNIAYIKQQRGVNCSGGICRVEPAFSGIRFTCSTNF
jgi:hypothetical protein